MEVIETRHDHSKHTYRLSIPALELPSCGDLLQMNKPAK